MKTRYDELSLKNNRYDDETIITVLLAFLVSFFSEIPGQISRQYCQNDRRQHIRYSDRLSPDKIDTDTEDQDRSDQREIADRQISHDRSHHSRQQRYAPFKQKGITPFLVTPGILDNLDGFLFALSTFKPFFSKKSYKKSTRLRYSSASRASTLTIA